MITYVQIGTYKSSKGPATYEHRKVILEGTETVDEVKAKIREVIKVTEFDSDELIVNGEKAVDSVNLNSFRNPEYNIYLIKREEPVDYTAKGRPAFSAMKSQNYEKAIQYRANSINREQIRLKFSKINSSTKNA